MKIVHSGDSIEIPDEFIENNPFFENYSSDNQILDLSDKCSKKVYYLIITELVKKIELDENDLIQTIKLSHLFELDDLFCELITKSIHLWNKIFPHIADLPLDKYQYKGKSLIDHILKHQLPEPLDNSIEYVCKYYLFSLKSIVNHIFRRLRKFTTSDASIFFSHSFYYEQVKYKLDDPNDLKILERKDHHMFSQILLLMKASI